MEGAPLQSYAGFRASHREIRLFVFAIYSLVALSEFLLIKMRVIQTGIRGIGTTPITPRYTHLVRLVGCNGSIPIKRDSCNDVVTQQRGNNSGLELTEVRKQTVKLETSREIVR